jgi:hypothetical protein
MINIDLETTEPCTSLGMITLDTVRPFLDLREGKTGETRWLHAVISLLTMSPRERATWLISSSAEGCYPVKLTKEQQAVWKRIRHELEMVRLVVDEPRTSFFAVAKEWMRYAFDGEELVLQKDDKEELISGDQLRELMQDLLMISPTIYLSLQRHILKFKNVDAWFSNNHDLIAEKAWEHNWLELVYG